MARFVCAEDPKTLIRGIVGTRAIYFRRQVYKKTWNGPICDAILRGKVFTAGGRGGRDRGPCGRDKYDETVGQYGGAN